MEQTTNDAAIDAAPEAQQPVAVAAAAILSGDDAVAEAVVDEAMPTPLESGSMEAEQLASAAGDDVADGGTAPVEMKTPTDGDNTAASPQGADVVEAGVQPTVGDAAIDDGSEIGPEEQPVSGTGTVMEGDAVAAAGSVASSSSSPDGVPGAVAEEPSAQTVGADDPTAVSLEHEVCVFSVDRLSWASCFASKSFGWLFNVSVGCDATPLSLPLI